MACIIRIKLVFSKTFKWTAAINLQFRSIIHYGKKCKSPNSAQVMWFINWFLMWNIFQNTWIISMWIDLEPSLLVNTGSPFQRFKSMYIWLQWLYKLVGKLAWALKFVTVCLFNSHFAGSEEKILYCIPHKFKHLYKAEKKEELKHKVIFKKTVLRGNISLSLDLKKAGLKYLHFALYFIRWSWQHIHRCFLKD